MKLIINIVWDILKDVWKRYMLGFFILNFWYKFVFIFVNFFGYKRKLVKRFGIWLFIVYYVLNGRLLKCDGSDNIW